MELSSTGAILRGIHRVVRALIRAPGFSVTVVLILGLAIGMSSAMFTVFEGLLLRPLPIAGQHRVVELTGASGDGADVPVSLEQLERFRDQTTALSDVAAYAHFGAFAFAIRDADRALDLRMAAVTGNFFDVLGVQPALGRLLTPGDERPWAQTDGLTGDYNIVISHETWQRVFGGDPGIVGHRLDTPIHDWDPVIVGVAPAGLDFPRGVDYWLPANYNSLTAFGRLAPGATLEAARVDYFRFIDADPDYRILGDHTLSAYVTPIAEAIVGDVRPALLALTAAVGLLLLLACVNIGNLLLVRSAGRAREAAIRRALGAGPLALLRGPLAESAVLAVASGLLGLLLARVLLDALLRLAPDVLPRADVIGSGHAPLYIAAAVTGLALLVCGLLPSLGSLRLDLAAPLRSDTRAGTESRGLRTLRQALVVSQMALALVVLAGAGLLLRSFARLAGMDFGFTTERLSLVVVAPPYERYVRECGGPADPADAERTAHLGACMQTRMFELHGRVETRLAALPDVVDVSSLLIPPFLGPSVFMTKVAAASESDAEAADNPWFGFDAVGPTFFRTLQVPILRGRSFTAQDGADDPRVAIVTEGAARALWPGEDALGKRIRNLGVMNPDSFVTVVGIVADVHYREHRVSSPTIYRPYLQAFAQGRFVVRTRGTLAAALPGTRAALREADAELVVTKAETMDELVAPQLAQPRLQALLLAAFGVAAIVIASIGLYGIMAQSVAQQRRELGVRMALGATADRLGRMVLRRATVIAGLGAVLGLAGALAASRVVASLLFRVSPVDPPTLAGVSLLLLIVAMVAAWVPARRAMGVDPAVALRAD